MRYTVDRSLGLRTPKLRFEYHVVRKGTTKRPGGRSFTVIDDLSPVERAGRHSDTLKVVDIVLVDSNKTKDKAQIHNAHIIDKNWKKNAEKTRKEHFDLIKPKEGILSIEYKHNNSQNVIQLVPRIDGLDVVPLTGEQIKETNKKRKTKAHPKGRDHNVKKDIKNATDELKNNVSRLNIIIIPSNMDFDTNSQKDKNMYVKTRKVKDDRQIKEFTKHVYEQTIKVFESIKQKMSDYKMKKEVESLMRSYDEKFGDFVRETQDQNIKTRLGGKKVILNTVDTSNRILDRLVNYLLRKMDDRGILRIGPAENVIKNEVNKKMELESKHICNKMHICRSKDSFASFVSDLLSAVLNSNDEKVIQFRDALTEIMRNTDVKRLFNAETEKRYEKSIVLLESYSVDIIRPLLFILKNLVTSKNSPIKVIGQIDTRVNKTIAYLEVLEMWENKIPPNEENLLVWNDIRNSMKDWSAGKRSDISDLLQAFVDHVMKAVNKFDDKESHAIAKNFYIMLGP